MTTTKKKYNTRTLTENRDAYVFIAPAALVIFIFMVIPTISLFYMSFRSSSFSGAVDTFVGWDNYLYLFDDLNFIRSIRSSLLFAAVGLPLQVGLALFLAIQVNKKIRGTTFYRTVFFIPVVISFVVASLMWKYLYNVDMGLINAVFNTIGLPRQNFLGDMNQALFCLVITYTWKTVGFYMMIYLSGLQGIPPELYESGVIDGANGWQRFRFITLPMLKNTTIFVVVIATINIIVKPFIPVFVMTEGGPRSATTMLVYYIWKSAFRLTEVGYASAAAVILFFFVLGITIAQFTIGEKE